MRKGLKKWGVFAFVLAIAILQARDSFAARRHKAGKTQETYSATETGQPGGEVPLLESVSTLAPGENGEASAEAPAATQESGIVDSDGNVAAPAAQAMTNEELLLPPKAVPAKRVARTKMHATVVGAKVAKFSPAKEFDVVPETQKDSIVKRLKITAELVARGRAYDYRSYTTAELEKILRDLDEAQSQ